mmetsp:Transcript_30239/g.70300  ORF Transcript_30239/g.70300 Transcript_30239/m.70300 type:complete len:122 (+) Transcript_30239:185-550(+)
MRSWLSLRCRPMQVLLRMSSSSVGVLIGATTPEPYISLLHRLRLGGSKATPAVGPNTTGAWLTTGTPTVTLMGGDSTRRGGQTATLGGCLGEVGWGGKTSEPLLPKDGMDEVRARCGETKV